MGKVIVPQQFAHDENMQRIIDAGGEVEIDLSDLDLPQIDADEEIIGELTPFEATMLREWIKCHKDEEDVSRRVGAKLLHILGDAIASGEKAETDVQNLTHADEARMLKRIERRKDYVYAALFYSIGERLDAHYPVAIREGGKIVRKKT